MNQRFGGVFTLFGFVAVYCLLRKFAPELVKPFLILSGIVALGVIVLVILAMYSAFHQPRSELSTESAAALQKGRAQLMEIRRLGAKVKDREIRGVCNSLCALLDKLLCALKEQPDAAVRSAGLFRQDLPALQRLLEAYALQESHGTPATDAVQETLAELGKIETALEAQYLSLVSGEKLP